MATMEYVLPRVEINRVLNRFKDRVIDFGLHYKAIEQDLIIEVLIVNDGPYRLQIIECVDLEEKNRYNLFCETLKMKQTSSA